MKYWTVNAYFMSLRVLVYGNWKWNETYYSIFVFKLCCGVWTRYVSSSALAPPSIFLPASLLYLVFNLLISFHHFLKGFCFLVNSLGGGGLKLVDVRGKSAGKHNYRSEVQKEAFATKCKETHARGPISEEKRRKSDTKRKGQAKMASYFQELNMSRIE